MINCLPLLSLCSGFVGLASGLHMQFRRQSPIGYVDSHGSAANFSSGDGNDPFQFTNVNGGDFKDIYVGTIIVGGQPYEVQLDTGSSDLWLDTAGVSTDGFTDTGVPGSIVYGDQTSAEGPILVGNVTFGTFTVPQQAFISAPGSNATTSGDKGLLGVGPPGLSNNFKSLSGTSFNGNSFLDNVFSIYPQDPNFITFSLSRSDLGITDGGIFSIATIPDGFTAIQSAAPIPVTDPSSGTPQWTCALDDVIVGGQSQSSSGTALLDTGTSLSQAPPSVVDAIYGSVTGAQLNGDSYVVPCDTKLDISFVIGGVTYPVHPIDATFIEVGDDGTVTCIGSFSYSDVASSGLDFIFGDSFLRNVFSLYDFGYWTTVGGTPPSMSLLSVTDATQADSEFDSLNQARLSQAQGASQNSTGSPDGSSPTMTPVPSPTDSGSTESPTDSGSAQSTTDSGSADSTASPAAGKIGHHLESSDSSGSDDLSGLTRNTFIIMGLLGGVILMLIILSAMVLVTSRNKGYRAVATTLAAPAPYQSKYNQYSRTSVDDKYHDT